MNIDKALKIQLNKKREILIGLPYFQAHHFKEHLHYVVCQLFCGCYWNKLPKEKMIELLEEYKIASKNFVYFIEYQIETEYPQVFPDKNKFMPEFWKISEDPQGRAPTELSSIEFSEGGIKFIDYLLLIYRSQTNKEQKD